MAKIHETMNGEGDSVEEEQLADRLSSPTRKRVRHGHRLTAG